MTFIMGDMMNELEIYRSMNTNLKQSLLYEYKKRILNDAEFLPHHVIIASVCYNAKILIKHLPQGNLKCRYVVTGTLKRIGVDVTIRSMVKHSDKLMYNNMIVHSRKIYRRLTIIGDNYDA